MANKRISIYKKALFTSVVFLLLVFACHQHFDQSWNSFSEDSSQNELVKEIREVLDLQRQLVAKELSDQSFLGNSYRRLSDLVPELGGEPVRSVIVTSWRSGSTFLTDVLNSHPSTFSHYEPLLQFSIVKIREPPLADQAKRIIRDLLNCDYSHYNIEKSKKDNYHFTKNTRLWDQCKRHPDLCWLPQFLSPFCRLFPFQVMKLIRVQLNVIEDLLSDERLNIRVVYLVRDPRGIMQSRWHAELCLNIPVCAQPKILCNDLVTDYKTVTRLSQKYPGRLKIVRYEDLALNPYETVPTLFKFLGLNFHQSVKTFLDTHTKEDIGGHYSTYRNSSTAPFHWQQDLSFRKVKAIQNRCTVAMRCWGYIKAENETHLLNFNPINVLARKILLRPKS